MYLIEKNIPMPEKKTKCKYPFKDMHIGDSFATDVGERAMRNAKTYATNYGRANGMKFESRVVGDALRIWRVA